LEAGAHIDIHDGGIVRQCSLINLGRPQSRPSYRLLPHRDAAQPGILLSTGFMVSCFPVRIERVSAGWIRAVAIIDG
jgi:hypothetical protein